MNCAILGPAGAEAVEAGLKTPLESLKIGAVALAASLAMGLAPLPAIANDAQDAESEPGRCMLARNVEHYRVIDGNWIVIADRREETFLLGHMQPRCWDLRSSFRIEILSPQISVCAGDLLDLSVEGERCRIVRLEPVSDYEDAEALVSERQSSE